MSNPFAARWTTKDNNMCLGHWEIEYAGRPVRLPTERHDEDMGTFGNFSGKFGDWFEGLSEYDWILENISWVTDFFVENDIPLDESHLRWFYEAVNKEDWRCNSCGGGCI